MYPTLEGVVPHTIRSMRKGDRKNICGLTLNTHTGTHIDYPQHIYEGHENGDVIEELTYRKVIALAIAAKEGQSIEKAQLQGYENEIKNCNLLLIRTGFGEYRRSDPERYTKWNPGLSEGAALYLKATFPALMAVGIDVISIGSFIRPRESHRVHEILLDSESRPPIFIIEDMNLSQCIARMQAVYIYPLFAGFDGSPCIIVGETE